MTQLDTGTPERIDPATLVAGIEITSDGGQLRVYAVRESIVLVHDAFLIIVCTDCGNIKSGNVFSGYSLSEQEGQMLQARINELARCSCTKHVALTEAEIRRDIVPVVLQELTQEVRMYGGIGR
jgi:hypothetical protein